MMAGFPLTFLCPPLLLAGGHMWVFSQVMGKIGKRLIFNCLVTYTGLTWKSIFTFIFMGGLMYSQSGFLK